MRIRFMPLVYWFSTCHFLASGAASAQTTAPVTPGPELAPILQNLSSNDFAVREAAQNGLRKIPAEQIRALQLFAGRETDPEIRARLAARVGEMAIELVHNPGTPAAAPFQLALRLVNPAGQPIAHASVDAAFYPQGPGARQYSDADGRVSFGVPLDENPYNLSVGAPGYDSHPIHVLKRPGVALADLVLKPGTPATTTKGVVVDEQGKPVANEKVQITSRYNREYVTATDAQGGFSFESFTPELREFMPQIKAGGLVAPLDGLQSRQPLKITLVRPATIAGKVIAKETGQGVGGVTVVARTNDYINCVAKTAADGSYTITGIPPGEYIVETEDAAYFDRPPLRNFSERPRYVLVSDRTVTAADIVVEKSAMLMGRVVDESGRGVAGASVGVPGTWNGNGQGQWRYVETDAEGRFLISTGHTDSKDLQIKVTSATAGAFAMMLPPVAPGEFQQLADIHMPGTVHYKGTVVDTAGKPISQVVCIFEDGGVPRGDPENAFTMEDGAFDFGRMSAPTGTSQPHIYFRAARPPIMDAEHPTMVDYIPPDFFGSWSTSDPPRNANFFVEVPSREKARTFYLHAELPATRPADGSTEMNMKVVLQTAHLLELTGIVVDDKGQPVAGAGVSLLRNGAEETTWQDYMRVMERTQGMGSTLPPPNVRRSLVHTGDDGRFHLYVIREEVQNRVVDREKRTSAPPQVVTLGARLGNLSAFLADQPIGDKEVLEFKLQLHETPPADPKRP